MRNFLSSLTICLTGLVQARLLRGEFVVHESLSPYKCLEELWDGEI